MCGSENIEIKNTNTFTKLKMIVLFYLFALTLADWGYKIEGGKETDKYKKWICTDKCKSQSPTNTNKNDTVNTIEGCKYASLSGKLTLYYNEFLGHDVDWPTNTIVACPGHRIELTLNLMRSANIILSGGDENNKTTYILNIPSYEKPYNITFEDNDGKMNDVIVSMEKGSYNTAVHIKSQTKVGNGYEPYKNPINFILSHFSRYENLPSYMRLMFEMKSPYTVAFKKAPTETAIIGFKTKTGEETVLPSKRCLSGYCYEWTKTDAIDDSYHKMNFTKTEFKCPENFGADYKYVKQGEGLITYNKLRSDCIEINYRDVKYLPCTAELLQVEYCYEYTTYEKLTDLKMTYVKENEIPAHIGYKVNNKGNCGAETSQMFYLIEGGDKCMKEDGKNFKAQIVNNKMKYTYYTDDKCTTVSTGTEATKEVPCEQCINYKETTHCKQYKDVDSKCTDDYQKDSKYIVIEEDGNIFVGAIGECIDLDAFPIDEFRNIGKAKLTPCFDKVVVATGCSGNESKKKNIDLQRLKTEFVKEISAHIAHGMAYSEYNCGTPIKGILLLYKNQCRKLSNSYNSYKSERYMIDGKKLIQKRFSDEDCQKVYEEEPTRELVCDECRGRSKLMCYEYGKKPNTTNPTKPNDGAFSTFILIVVAMVFFLF